MKSLLVKIFKIFLIGALAVLVILLVFGVALTLGWPWWMGFFLLLGLLGLLIGLLFLRRLWQKRREQSFVDQIIAQDESRLKSVAGREREQLQDLQVRWKEAVEALRRSHLKKHGNPLYVLPWYLVIGESGSGKTTAIESARLSSPFAEMSRTSGISGTRNCDWWFFEQAIIVDTAGRYAIPIDEGRDKDEWQKFLSLLSKYRKKEPLNGLIVTISADKLLEGRSETLEDDGRSIRRRVDELMRVLGAKSPIYVLVTKCDLVQGMTQFADQFSEKSLQQAMGVINHSLSKDVVAFTVQTIKTIGDRLRDLRLLLLHRSEARTVDPALLLFPEEFARLENGLGSFLNGAFLENPYQETPLLRGLFFSSGRQEGSPFSHFLKALDLIAEKDLLPGTNRGLFLHDFFALILPKDRRLFAPTQRALEWSRLTKHLGLTAFVAIVLAICGLLSYSFVKNLRILREVPDHPRNLTGEVVKDVVMMDDFQQDILKVGERNLSWLMPRFGLDQSEQVEGELKRRYCERFRVSFLGPFDEKMSQTIAKFSVTTADEVIVHHVTHLVRRINLLRTRLAGQGLEVLRQRPLPSYEPIVMQADQAIQADLREMFGRIYLHYLDWRSDSSKMNLEMVDLQKWLAYILTTVKPDMRWLVVWANGQESLTPFTLQDFWSGSVALPDEPTVARAYTREGSEHIVSFLQELENALPDPGPPMIASQKIEYQNWYRASFFETWHGFAAAFSKGSKTLQGKPEWQKMATTVAAGQGPYLTLLDTMAQQLEPVASEGEMPPWLEPLYLFQEIKEQAVAQASVKDLSALAKVTKKGQQLVNKVGKAEKKLAQVKAAGRTAESQLLAVKAYQDQQNALAEIGPLANSRKLAFQMTSQVFSEDEATGKSPFFTAQQAVVKLKASMGGGEATEEIFGKLISGPTDYLWTYARMETACQLQERWEQDVLTEVQGAPNWQQLVLGKDGYGWKYVKGPAEPFISRTVQKGYYARTALGGKIPFEASFFSFLQRGATATTIAQSNYQVGVKALPTGANPGALLPHLTTLELQCGDEVQELLNRNYPVGKTFNWAPQNCGDVVFTVEVGDVTLGKRYTGQMAFPDFLNDFRKGKRTFYIKEFPEQQAALKRMGIQYITVTYQFSGHSPILKLLRSGPRILPRSIVACWDQ